MTDTTGRGPYTGDWYDRRNKRRRDRYKKEPDYRAKANAAARDGYRTAAGAGSPPDLLANIHMLQPGATCVGRMRLIKNAIKAVPKLTFTKGELAEVFGRPVKQVQQWAAGDARISGPVLKGRQDGYERVWLDVYSYDEAVALVTALAPYLKDLIYFRTDHTEAINAGRDALAKVRRKMEIPPL